MVGDYLILYIIISYIDNLRNSYLGVIHTSTKVRLVKEVYRKDL